MQVRVDIGGGVGRSAIPPPVRGGSTPERPGQPTHAGGHIAWRDLSGHGTLTSPLKFEVRRPGCSKRPADGEGAFPQTRIDQGRTARSMRPGTYSFFSAPLLPAAPKDVHPRRGPARTPETSRSAVLCLRNRACIAQARAGGFWNQVRSLTFCRNIRKPRTAEEREPNHQRGTNPMKIVSDKDQLCGGRAQKQRRFRQNEQPPGKHEVRGAGDDGGAPVTTSTTPRMPARGLTRRPERAKMTELDRDAYH